MKLNFGTIYAVTMLGFLIFSSPLTAEDDNATWSQSYESYRKHFKSLPPSETSCCERLLKEILNALDTKNQCNSDDDCVLIDQEPFGDTVPFPGRLSDELRAKMKQYCERCNDGSFHSITDEDLIHTPICHEGKCMVSTSLKQKRSK